MEKKTKNKAIIAAAVTGAVVASGAAGYTLYKRSKKGSKKRPVLVPKEETTKAEKKPKVSLLKNKKNK